jgi:VWFA-related protein
MGRMAFSFSVLVALLAGPVAASGGTQAAAPARDPSLPAVSETINVRVVNVEAVVTDAGGNPVHGLTAADFRLVVDGKEVAVDYFTEVLDGKAAAGEPGTAPAGPSAPVPAGAEVARNFLVFVDDGFAIGAYRNAALENLGRNLSLLRPADRMAVVAFDGSRLAVLSGWTADQAALAAALQQAELHTPRGHMVLAQARSIDNDISVVRDINWDGDLSVPFVADTVIAELRSLPSPEARSQANKSLNAAAAALRGFELPAGRRSLLLLSGAWSMGLGSGWSFSLPLLAAANQLGYTLYPIDVAGAVPEELRFYDGLARRTGGWAVSGTVPAAMGRIVADLSSYYWLGFTPSGAAGDRQHRIEVKVRRPELLVRARRSYSEVSRSTAAALKAQSVLLFGSLEATQTASATAAGSSGVEGLGGGPRRLRVELGTLRRGGLGRLTVPVTLYVPNAALSFTARGRKFVAEVPLAAAVLDQEGDRAQLQSKIRFTFDGPPTPDGEAHYSTTLMLRRIRQHVVFTVPDAQTSDILTGEISIEPPG